MNFELSFEEYSLLRRLIMQLPANDVYELLIKLDSQVAGQLKIGNTNEVRPAVSMAKSGGK